MLPQFTYDVWRGPRRDAFAASMVLHVVAVAVLVAFPVREAVTVHPVNTSNAVQLIAPPPLRPTQVMPPPVKITAPPQVVHIRPLPRPIERAVAPKVQTQVAKLDVPPIVAQPVVVPKPAEAPRAPVKTGGFDPPKNTVATTRKPARQVQTGGFGDPNGVPGTGKPNAAVTIASLGSFDLPGGPGAGNGSGGRRGERGTVVSAGFGSGVSGADPGPARPGQVTSAGFGDAAVAAAAAPKAAAQPRAARTSPVEIVYKPRPQYTAEGRQLRIQGEVLLNVLFAASGQVQVQGVVKGLGHGLDQAAVNAARQIRFRPATRDGQPYDSAALVHIVFELAD